MSWREPITLEYLSQFCETLEVVEFGVLRVKLKPGIDEDWFYDLLPIAAKAEFEL
jgi:hypothetical protein